MLSRFIMCFFIISPFWAVPSWACMSRGVHPVFEAKMNLMSCQSNIRNKIKSKDLSGLFSDTAYNFKIEKHALSYLKEYDRVNVEGKTLGCPMYEEVMSYKFAKAYRNKRGKTACHVAYEESQTDTYDPQFSHVNNRSNFLENFILTTESIKKVRLSPRNGGEDYYQEHVIRTFCENSGKATLTEVQTSYFNVYGSLLKGNGLRKFTLTNEVCEVSEAD